MIKISHNLTDLIKIIHCHYEEAYRRFDKDIQLDGKGSVSDKAKGTSSLTYNHFFSVWPIISAKTTTIMNHFVRQSSCSIPKMATYGFDYTCENTLWCRWISTLHGAHGVLTSSQAEQRGLSSSAWCRPQWTLPSW